MPRRKRYYVYCKKGLHLMTEHGRIGLVLLGRKTHKSIRKYTRTYCKACRKQYQHDYYQKKHSALLKKQEQRRRWKAKGRMNKRRAKFRKTLNTLRRNSK